MLKTHLWNVTCSRLVGSWQLSWSDCDESLTCDDQSHSRIIRPFPSSVFFWVSERVFPWVILPQLFNPEDAAAVHVVVILQMTGVVSQLLSIILTASPHFEQSFTCKLPVGKVFTGNVHGGAFHSTDPPADVALCVAAAIIATWNTKQKGRMLHSEIENRIAEQRHKAT